MSQPLLDHRYRLEDELGRGGMGTVHRAFDTTLEREVAIKLVTGYEKGTEARARLLQEAKSIAQLNHPNIVTVHDAGETDQAPYIVMELIEGESLHDQPPQDLQELVRIASQVCAALDHAHARGIVHRDLKPENILIDSDRTAKLMDFGIARSMASRMTQEGRIEGTVFYMAPELALGKDFDGRADLYALGVVLYELATNELPFQHGDPVAVISQHVHAPIVPPRAKNPEIPAGLDGLIVQLMQKEPDDRPVGAAQVETMLQDASLMDTTLADRGQLSTIDRIVRGRMIGREVEFEQARELWKLAVAGSSQIVLVSGEPGVGKTRLLREIITQSEIMGAQVLGAASYAEGGPPYSPFKQILREVLPKVSQNGFNLPEYVIADLLSLAPELQARFPKVSPNPSDDPKSEQFRLFENFFIFMASLSQHGPLLVYLDDAHWADSGSLSLFRHLARQVESHPIMLLATYREVELDEARPLQEVLLDISREPQTTRIKLNRLTMEQTEDLLASFFQEEITPEFVEGIYRETEGNPFFIEEVCKALVESGKLYYAEGRWHRPEMRELGIPQSVRVAIQARIGKLSPETQEVLNQAAVLGREFDLEALITAMESEEDAIIVALEEAERAQLIEERSEDGELVLSFSHALVPSTLVEGLRILQRRRLHSRAAAALQIHDPENYPALGKHLLEAGKTEQGVDCLLMAGDQARALHAHQEAIDSYLQALDYAKETEDHGRAARTYMKLGVAYHNAFDFERSREAYEQGFLFWQRAGKGGARAKHAHAPHPLRLVSLPPPTLDPSLTDDSTSGSYVLQLFSGLVELAPDMSVVPDLARSWEVLEGGRKYHFHLRDDVRWSDGTSLTAGDFEFAWKRALDPDLNSPTSKYLFDLKGAAAYHGSSGSAEDLGVKALDDLTLLVELESPTGYFLQLLSSPSLFAIPRHAVEEHGPAWTEADKIVTVGPFRLKEFGEQDIRLEKNSTYHGRAEGNVAEVHFIFPGQEQGMELRLYEQSLTDKQFLSAFSPEEQDRARQWFADDYLAAPVLGMFYVGFDTTRAPFDDVRVRRAFCQAIDRTSMAEISFRGYYAPGNGGLVPPGLPGHTPDIALPFDPSAAALALEQAGFPAGEGFPQIECWGSSVSLAKLVAELLESQWREHLRVETQFETMDWGAYLDRMKTGIPNVWLMGWGADYPDADNFLRLAMTKDGKYFWPNTGYQDLVERARRSIDHDERIEFYERAQRLMAEEVPAVPLLYHRGHLLLKPWISEFPLCAMRGDYYKDVVIEPHE